MSSSAQSYSHLSRRVIASNSRFEVYFDSLLVLDGSIIHDYLVVSPKIRSSPDIVGVCVLPYFNDRFWLMKCWRHQCEDYVWQAPSGFLEKNEKPSESASRELYEESGFSCTSMDLIPLGSFYPDPGLINGCIALFLSNHIVQMVTPIGCEVGLGELRPFTDQELLHLILNSSNISGASIVTCFRSLAYIKSLGS